MQERELRHGDCMWREISTAPFERDLELGVIDGDSRWCFRASALKMAGITP